MSPKRKTALKLTRSARAEMNEFLSQYVRAIIAETKLVEKLEQGAAAAIKRLFGGFDLVAHQKAIAEVERRNVWRWCQVQDRMSQIGVGVIFIRPNGDIYDHLKSNFKNFAFFKTGNERMRAEALIGLAHQFYQNAPDDAQFISLDFQASDFVDDLRRKPESFT